MNTITQIISKKIPSFFLFVLNNKKDVISISIKPMSPNFKGIFI